VAAVCSRKAAANKVAAVLTDECYAMVADYTADREARRYTEVPFGAVQG